MERRIFGVATVVVFALVTSACGSGADTTQIPPPEAAADAATFEQGGVSFEYPADWETQADAPMTMEMDTEAFAEAIGPDENNVVAIQSATVEQEVTEDDVTEARSALDAAIRALIEGGGGEVTSGPDDLDAGGGFGYSWDFSGVDLEGTIGSGRAAIFFVGSNEYVVLCVYTDAQDEIEAGCNQILTTFEVA